MESTKMTDGSGFWGNLGELFAGAGVPLLLSLAASLVRFLKFGWQSWHHFFSSLFTSIFVGQVVYWGLSYFDLEPSVDAAIISLSAYMGGSLLDAVVFRVRSEIREVGGGIPVELPIKKKGRPTHGGGDQNL